MKRSGKYYRKNEKQVMRELGFEPTPGSGSGWLIKEDGQTEHTIAQLKSTDAGSINVSLYDMQTLEYNAQVAHKNPIFVIQFLKDNSTYLIVKPTTEILKAIHEQKVVDSVELEGYHLINDKQIKTGSTERDGFYKEREKTHEQSQIDRKIRRPHRQEKPKRRLEPELPI